MKSIQNYSINVKVLEEFNREVPSGQRSEIVEALLIHFLVKYSRENKLPTIQVESPITTKEVH